MRDKLQAKGQLVDRGIANTASSFPLPHQLHRIIVCGGRDFTDAALLDRALSELNRTRGPIALLIHGNAKGADILAGKWAKANGVRCHPEPANWIKYGNAAGPIRNKSMLRFKPDAVVAFPGGKGTRDMIKQARQAGIEIIIGEHL